MRLALTLPFLYETPARRYSLSYWGAES